MEFFYHVFPNRDSNGKITITSDVFKCAMTKRGGFLSFLKRHSGARVAMDNAPCHNGSFRTFKENEVVVLDFPPKSPDLNPIENIWEIMDAFIERAVDYIKTDGHDMLINTLNSMPRRFDIVVEKNEKVVIISRLNAFYNMMLFIIFVHTQSFFCVLLILLGLRAQPDWLKKKKKKEWIGHELLLFTIIVIKIINNLRQVELLVLGYNM